MEKDTELKETVKMDISNILKELLKLSSATNNILRQLLRLLLLVALQEERKEIIEYGRELIEISQEKELTRDEALIVRVILKIIEENPGITKIQTQQITRILNMDLPLIEQYASSEVGKTCVRLGLIRTKVKGERGYRWTKSTLEKLTQGIQKKKRGGELPNDIR